MEEKKPAIKRNQDGTIAKGSPSLNPSGRPKNTLKDYLRQKFCAMSDAEKEEFIKRIDPIDLFKMAEGNPHQTTDVAVKELPEPILGGLSQNAKVQRNNSSIQDS